ncbi:helix-turn-helix domain-containing protein [Emticicia sp. W12TSBA100-4]|uniref:helix-turn-helix domain-containing protein n=1 Tax=Emticicia sp. W12TSBA100-4 TaxID=3160965 RepID=UPI003305979D
MIINGIIISQDPNTFLAQIGDLMEEKLRQYLAVSSLVTGEEEMTIEEVAELLKCTRQTINNYARQGVLKKYLRGGKPYFLRREVIVSGRETKLKRKTKKG